MARNNLDGRGRGHTDIANGFKLGGGVDVGNYRIAGIHFFKLFNNFSVHLLGHRASCVLVGEVNGLFGGENLDRFGHKTHSAHYNGFVFNRRSLFCKSIAVSHKIGDLGNFTPLIRMGKNTNILLLLEL